MKEKGEGRRERTKNGMEGEEREKVRVTGKKEGWEKERGREREEKEGQEKEGWGGEERTGEERTEAERTGEGRTGERGVQYHRCECTPTDGVLI